MQMLTEKAMKLKLNLFEVETDISAETRGVAWHYFYCAVFGEVWSF